MPVLPPAQEPSPTPSTPGVQWVERILGRTYYPPGTEEKAHTRNVPVSKLKWVNRPAQRRKMPASHFLLPAQRKFPYRNPDGTINCRLVRAAISRAAQHGHAQVKAKAQNIYRRNCQKKGN